LLDGGSPLETDTAEDDSVTSPLETTGPLLAGPDEDKDEEEVSPDEAVPPSSPTQVPPSVVPEATEPSWSGSVPVVGGGQADRARTSVVATTTRQRKRGMGTS
jgi:hypothetical protein